MHYLYYVICGRLATIFCVFGLEMFKSMVSQHLFPHCTTKYIMKDYFLKWQDTLSHLPQTGV